MSNEKFTQKAEEALNNSLQVAERLGASYIGSEHILLALCESSGSVAAKLLLENGVISHQLASAICECEGLYKKSKLTVKNLTPRARRVLDSAAKNAFKYGSFRIGTEHILLSILEEKDTAAIKILSYLGVDISILREKTRQKLRECEKAFGRTEDEKLKSVTIPFLQKYGKCLSDPNVNFGWNVVGRDQLIERLIRTLSRKTKNNPVLLGEAGVGKTAIVEGLAMRIGRGEVPDILRSAMLISIDLTKIVAGTKYRGDFEERIKQILDECKKNPQIILFIDELHTVIGAGAAEGAVDLANIIKPELSRGEIRVIGATTPDEYSRHIEKDSALERRFQPILVEEPSFEDSCVMMRSVAPTFERHHHVCIDDAAIEASVELSTRYMHQRYRPDKCIDLLDEACACVSVRQNNAVDFTPKVTRNDIIKVINEFNGRENNSLELKLNQDSIRRWFNDVCFGQDDAALALSRAVVRSRCGIADPMRPLGSYFFYGDSGVGKTKMAKSLAQLLFHDESACISLDMSEYSEAHSVSKLIGAPQGYIGYDEGGILTGAIKKRPYAVVLFDEIEKAHRDVFHLLLQILEEGRLSDSTGKMISFRNTYIIFTSNITANIEESCGFLCTISHQNSKATEIEMLKKHFPIEFISRIDDFIRFNSLRYADLEKICRAELSILQARLEQESVVFHYDDEVIRYLIESTSSLKLGARQIKHKIRAELESRIADIMLVKEEKEKRLQATIVGDEIVLLEKDVLVV